MIFKQFFDKVSCTYTYLIADKKGSEAYIIDPVFDNIDSYLKVIKNLKLNLIKVIDAHIHSDHITGVSALKEDLYNQLGSTIILSQCVIKYFLKKRW